MRMRSLTVVVCLLAGPVSAAAQDRVQGGLIAGPSSSSFSATGDFAPDFTARGGFSGGLFVVTPSRHHVAFEPEALFTMKGANGEDSTAKVSFRVNYLEFPLLARIDSAGGGRATAHVVAGPVLGIRLSAHETIETSAGKSEEDVKDQSRGGAMSLAVGGGVDAGRFRIDARYTWGLSRLNTEESAGFDIKSREFTVLAGVTLW